MATMESLPSGLSWYRAWDANMSRWDTNVSRRDTAMSRWDTNASRWDAGLSLSDPPWDGPGAAAGPAASALCSRELPAASTAELSYNSAPPPARRRRATPTLSCAVGRWQSGGGGGGSGGGGSSIAGGGGSWRRTARFMSPETGALVAACEIAAACEAEAEARLRVRAFYMIGLNVV